MKILLIGITLSFSLLTTISSAQHGVAQSDRDMFGRLLKGAFGSDYYLGDLINVDSSSILRGDIRDPYGTLQHCFVFTGTRMMPADSDYNTGVICVYRDNQIIWHSGGTVRLLCGDRSAINAIMDLNRDGRLEIVASWDGGCSRLAPSHMWVFRWDGQIGTAENEINAEDGTSTMIGGDNSDFETVDINADGVWEIQTGYVSRDVGENANGAPEEYYTEGVNTYQWNGQAYSLSSFKPSQGEDDSFYPRNGVIATIQARASWVSNSLRYTYAMTNASNSPQDINRLYVDIDSVATLDVRGRNYWHSYPWGRLFSWHAYNEDQSTMFIHSGEADSSFSFLTTSLPTIAYAYVQGFNKEPQNPSIAAIDADIAGNSVLIRTIAPVKRDSPFVALNFLDTLISYTTRSRMLGWITSQPTADKYTGLFTRTRSDLQTANLSTARTHLDTVLQQMRVDSGASLTSEAYALLRFNTEYLDTMLAR